MFEGDGFLFPFVYDEICTLCEICENPVNIFSDESAAEREKSIECVKPAFDYFLQRMKTDCLPRVAMARLARILNPTRVLDIGISIDDATAFCNVFPFKEFRTPEFVKSLCEELPAYKSRAASCRIDETGPHSVTALAEAIWLWWSRQESFLPTWCAAAKVIALISPSSAAVERVFSILRRHFGDDQKRSLEDYVEGSVMLEYNSKDPWPK